MADTASVMEWTVSKNGPVATIKWTLVEKPLKDFAEHHISFALAIESVRFDDTVRVVVITGGDEGGFEIGPQRDQPGKEMPREVMNPATRPGGPSAMVGPWSLSQGIERTYQALALIEKPVVGRLNGDAYGFAMHLLWGCDVIVADEDARLGDLHLSLDPMIPYGMSAGDGAFAFMPLFLPPTKLKEFLLLGATWTAKDFADMNMINYAVPASELDTVVNGIVAKFLARPARALARTKRAANKRLIEQMNLTLDYAWMAEAVDCWEIPQRDWKPDTTLRPDDPAWTVTDPNAPVDKDPQHGS